MIERLISFSLRQKLFIAVCVIIIAAAGVYSFLRLPIDAFPDVTNIQVEILSSAPGRSPLEVEKFITYPVETGLRGLPGLVEIRSISKFGLSVITAVFEDGVDIYFARQLVLERLIEAKERVPEGVEIAMGPVATAMGEIYQYTLEGGTAAGKEDDVERLTELRTLQDWTISPLLKTIPGVNEVNSFGGYLRQYHVQVDPDKLRKFGIPLGGVVEALKRNNQNVGGNIIQKASQQYLVRSIGLLRGVDDIRLIVLRSEGGVPVLIRDVAELTTGTAVRQGASVMNGEKEVVGGIAMMLRGANSREVVRLIENKVADHQTQEAMDLREDARRADEQDARRHVGFPGDDLHLQPAHRLPDRRAGGRDEGSDHHQALRRRPGRPQREIRGDRQGRLLDPRRPGPRGGEGLRTALRLDRDRQGEDRPPRHQRG